jgi:hypothetical protein
MAVCCESRDANKEVSSSATLNRRGHHPLWWPSLFFSTISDSSRVGRVLPRYRPTDVPGPIDRHLPINHHRHKSVGYPVLELNDLVPLSCQLPPAAGLLSILLDGLILAPSMVKASVLRRCLVLRLTESDFPFTSTVLLLIICWAIEPNDAVLIMAAHPLASGIRERSRLISPNDSRFLDNPQYPPLDCRQLMTFLRLQRRIEKLRK